MSGISLEVEFVGVNLKNPFMLASAPPTMDARHIIRAARLGWGGAVIKTIAETPTVDPRTRLGVLRRGDSPIGMNNIELISRATVERWTQEYIPQIRQESPDDFIIVGSIMSGPEPEGWTKMAEAISQAPVDIIELNVSCPHGMPEKHMGAFIGQSPDLVGQVTKAAKKGTDLPIIVKLTPNVTDVVAIAEAAISAEANGLAAINTVQSLIGIDLETATPLPMAYGFKSGEALSTYGGFCGPAVRPIGLRIVSQIAKAFPDIPISGIGGIEDWYSSAEYIMVGAKSLQVCTAVMWYGYGIIKRLTENLLDFMKNKGYDSLDSMIGKALPKLTTWEALSKLPPIVAQVTDACSGCKKCIIACADGGFLAIQMRDGKALVNPDKCDGCGLCAVICPDDAIEFVSS